MPVTPTVSVVIPTYKGSSFITEAIESACRQDLQPCEIIVVDDASPDGTADLVESFGSRLPVPLHVLRLAENSGGPARPINVGIAAAAGEFIAVCDQDDVFLPDRIALHARILARRPDISMAFGLAESFTTPTRVLQTEASLAALEQESTETSDFRIIEGLSLLKWLIVRGNQICGYPGFMFRKIDWARKGGVDEALLIGSDYDLLCWLAGIGSAAYTPVPIYRRRMHEGNATRNILLMYSENIKIRCRYSRQWKLSNPSDADRLRLMDSVEGNISYMSSNGHYGRTAVSCLKLLAAFSEFRPLFLKRTFRKLTRMLINQ